MSGNLAAGGRSSEQTRTTNYSRGVNDGSNWVQSALPVAVAPWLLITGVVLTSVLDQPLMLAAGGIAFGVAVDRARRATPEEDNWWAPFSPRHFAVQDASTAARWCRWAAWAGLAVLAAMFFFLVMMSLTSSTGD